jgi:Tol biopolymer transport system component
MAKNTLRQPMERLNKKMVYLTIGIGILLVVFVLYAMADRLTLNSANCSNHQGIALWSIRPHPILGAIETRESVCIDGSGSIHYPMPKQLENADEVVFSSDGERIAYSDLKLTQLTASYHIHIINADGSDVYHLADTGNHAARLAWSSDGTRLAFDGLLDAGPGIYIVNLNCFEEEQKCIPAPRFLGEGTEPSWSPNGEKIAFVVDSDPRRGISNHDIYVMNTDGSDRVNVTAGEFQDQAPAWSPDGELIAFYSSSRKPRGIYLMKPDGSDLRFLTEGSMPLWSPDGGSLAFVSERDNKGKVISISDWNAPAQALYTISRDGTGIKRLTFSDREYIKTFTWLPLVSSKTK